MKALIKIEWTKLFAGRKALFLFSLFALMVTAFIFFMRAAASEASFGSIFNETIRNFSLVVMLIGVVLTIVSLHQEMQQKTLKTLLVTPVSRTAILGAKLTTSFATAVLVMAILIVLTFVLDTALFGYFATGPYTSVAEANLEFKAGLLQSLTMLVSTLFYSSLILSLFLITRSFSMALIGTTLLKALGETLTRNMLENKHHALLYSPLGMLNIPNPLTTVQQDLATYGLQIGMSIVYSALLFYLSCYLFERREF